MNQLLSQFAADFTISIHPIPHVKANSTEVTAILSLVFSLIGAICLLMVTIGGFRYVASQGDPQATSKAKSTIIYALIGLLVSISAVAIVTFVLGKV